MTSDYYVRHVRSGTTTERTAYAAELGNVAADIGRLWWDTTLTALYYWSGVAWVAVGSGTFMDGRLTLESGVPISTTNQSAKGTLYYTPYTGNRVSLFDGTRWEIYEFTERSISLAGLNNNPHDVFLYDNAGTLTLNLVEWTDATTRATALTTQDNIYVKTGATSYRYLGTIYVDASAQCNMVFKGTPAKMEVWNYNNRVCLPVEFIDSTASWNYDTATWRYRNNTANNQFQFVRGLNEDPVEALFINAARSSDTTAINAFITMMIDWPGGVPSGTDCTVHPSSINVLNVSTIGIAHYQGRPTAGYHTLDLLERGSGTGATLTWAGPSGSGAAYLNTGAKGEIWA